MGVLEFLTIVFVVLKLTEVIDWSWWFVFAPMYIYVVAIVMYLFFMFLGAMVAIVKHK